MSLEPMRPDEEHEITFHRLPAGWAFCTRCRRLVSLADLLSEPRCSGATEVGPADGARTDAGEVWGTRSLEQVLASAFMQVLGGAQEPPVYSEDTDPSRPSRGAGADPA
jgi:hypothetical protein